MRKKNLVITHPAKLYTVSVYCIVILLLHLGILLQVIAAKRAGVDTVILPSDNRKDYDDLPQLVKDDVTVHFAETYDDVYKIAFPTPPS